MGLDMYLDRYPRYKNYGPVNICAYEEYRSWQKNEEAQEHTFEGWCGCKMEDLPTEEDMKYLDQFMETKYYAWDDDHCYPHEGVRDHVAYWRKANQVHKWFVDNVQGGEDDCDFHDEVTKEKLEELRDICREILENAVLVNGKVQNGFNLDKDGKWVPIMQDGKTVLNPDICEELLPTTDGFFFGGTGYDEWYLEDIKYTWEVCNKILEETDFDKQMLFYCSSW